MNNEDRHSPIQFGCYAPEAKEVFVAGTFNGWKPDTARLHHHPAEGNWTVTLPLPTGRHEYKFVIDGQWCCEAGCKVERRGCPMCVVNEFGTMNRVLVVD